MKKLTNLKCMKLVQRYDEKQLIPRNLLGSCRSCCDWLGDLRQSRGIGGDYVGGHCFFDTV